MADKQSIGEIEAGQSTVENDHILKINYINNGNIKIFYFNQINDFIPYFTQQFLQFFILYTLQSQYTQAQPIIEIHISHPMQTRSKQKIQAILTLGLSASKQLQHQSGIKSSHDVKQTPLKSNRKQSHKQHAKQTKKQQNIAQQKQQLQNAHQKGKHHHQNEPKPKAKTKQELMQQKMKILKRNRQQQPIPQEPQEDTHKQKESEMHKVVKSNQGNQEKHEAKHHMKAKSLRRGRSKKRQMSENSVEQESESQQKEEKINQPQKEQKAQSKQKNNQIGQHKFQTPQKQVSQGSNHDKMAMYLANILKKKNLQTQKQQQIDQNKPQQNKNLQVAEANPIQTYSVSEADKDQQLAQKQQQNKIQQLLMQKQKQKLQVLEQLKQREMQRLKNKCMQETMKRLQQERRMLKLQDQQQRERKMRQEQLLKQKQEQQLRQKQKQKQNKQSPIQKIDAQPIQQDQVGPKINSKMVRNQIDQESASQQQNLNRSIKSDEGKMVDQNQQKQKQNNLVPYSDAINQNQQQKQQPQSQQNQQLELVEQVKEPIQEAGTNWWRHPMVAFKIDNQATSDRKWTKIQEKIKLKSLHKLNEKFKDLEKEIQYNEIKLGNHQNKMIQHQLKQVNLRIENSFRIISQKIKQLSQQLGN